MQHAHASSHTNGNNLQTNAKKTCSALPTLHASYSKTFNSPQHSAIYQKIYLPMGVFELKTVSQ